MNLRRLCAELMKTFVSVRREPKFFFRGKRIHRKEFSPGPKSVVLWL